MAERRPLVLDNGRLKELPVGDTVAGVPVSGSGQATGTGGVIDGGSRIDSDDAMDGGERV